LLCGNGERRVQRTSVDTGLTAGAKRLQDAATPVQRGDQLPVASREI
jgi:hypothetical protein